jgi:hypothetical protein
MKIAFTLCSNNYLGAAKVLVDSFKQHHPDFQVLIGLVDKRDPAVDYAFLGCTVLSVDEVKIPDIEGLSRKFNITELNTTVKPFYFMHFFGQGATQVIYLDPDIEIFGRLEEVLKGMETAMITLTPHIMSPLDDKHCPSDYDLLRTGTFNLGFVALSAHPQLAGFLDWWAERCVKFGFRRDTVGMFYDQIWINLVPAFYESHYIIRHPGYNMANWNLHERQLSKDASGQWVINGSQPLVFFHYSSYSIKRPDVLSSYNDRFSFTNRPDVKPLFEAYYAQVVANRGIELSGIEPYYRMLFSKAEALRIKAHYTFKRKLKNKLTNMLTSVLGV